MSLYIGINNSVKKISKLLVGANSSVKEVTTGYAGGGNSKNLVYQNKLDVDSELNKVNPVKALVSGQVTKDYIGRVVTLSNSKCACQDWIIVGVKDNTSVVLLSKTTLWDLKTTGGVCPYNYVNVGRDDTNHTYGSGTTKQANGEVEGYHQYYLNQVADSFTDDIKNSLIPMSVEYCNTWQSGSYGGDWDTFYLTQKICIPGDGDIKLELENGDRIFQGSSSNGSTWRFDHYVGGIGDEYSTCNVEWYYGSQNGWSNIALSVKSYDMSMMLERMKGPSGQTTNRYPLRSVKYNSSYGHYYIYTDGSRSYSTSCFSNANTTPPFACGAYICIGDPIKVALAQKDPVDILTSGKITKDYIGSTVYLTNSKTDCKEWIIADIGHDGVEGAVDLYPKYTLGHTAYTSASNYGRYNYSECDYGNAVAIVGNGFSDDVKNALIRFGKDGTGFYASYYSNYTWSTEIQTNKIKAPSITELGLTLNNIQMASSTEGSKYPIFNNSSDRILKSLASSQDPIYYYTRSRIAEKYVGCVNISGYSVSRYFDVGADPSYGYTGFIRFGKKTS